MIDKGLLLFGFIIGIVTVMAAIFASSVIPIIFKTEDVVISFNQSQIQVVNELKELAHQGKQQSSLNVNMTKINAQNIENILDNISAINAKIK